MKIAEDVLLVLDHAETVGNSLRLVGQLDRKLYERTNKVLEAAGGKWNRAAKAHLFPGDARDTMEQIILTGEIQPPQDFGYFPTPRAVVDVLLQHADLHRGAYVLEPSAGQGAIVGPLLDAQAQVDGVELQEKNVTVLRPMFPQGALHHGDFLAMEPTPKYDRVVMNPPFAKQDDIRHVTHALKFLREGGRLVSVMSSGVSFRDNKLTTDFRALVECRGGFIEPLPENSFKASGTAVNTVIAMIPA